MPAQEILEGLTSAYRRAQGLFVYMWQLAGGGRKAKDVYK